MKVTVLMDNNTKINVYYLGEPGASFWIETEGKKFLFDTGYSDAFLKNADDMHIPVTDADAVLFSHHHDDHTRGLTYLLQRSFEEKPKVIAHPDVFLRHERRGENIGCPFTEEEVREKTNLTLSKDPVWLTDKLVWLGEIPRVVEFEKPYTLGDVVRDGKLVEDYIMDDTALAYCGEEGLSIVTGCSHSGICNIITQAKNITGIDHVHSLLGGFHLFEVNEKTKKTIEFLKKENIPELYPCHCTTFAVRAAIDRESPVKEVSVGMKMEWK